MNIKASSVCTWWKVGTAAILAALVLTAAPGVALSQPAPPAASSEATPPLSPSSPPANRVPLEKLLGRQVLVKIGSQETVGKLVELSDTSAVIEKDRGERVTLERDRIMAARGRFSQPSPARSWQPSSPDGEGSATDENDWHDTLFDSRPKRVFGIGTAVGGGFAATTVTSSSRSDSSLGPALLLPTLELQFFTSGGSSIDITMPLTNMILVSNALEGVVVTADVFFNFNVGKGSTRLVIGPGVGFSIVAVDRGSAGSFRLPAELGFEVLNKKQSFGFKLLARPWFEIASGSRASATGGGLLGALVFSGYATSMRE